MKIKIYQINLDRDVNQRAFMSLLNPGLIDFQSYDEVWSGYVECDDLEDVFRMFNLHHPIGYNGRSLSVSDIVYVNESKNIESGFYFCDSIGWGKIHHLILGVDNTKIMRYN